MQENIFAVFKFKVTVRAQMIKYMIVSDVSIELLIFLHPNLVGWHIIINWRGVFFVLLRGGGGVYVRACVCKNLIVVFKVQVSVKDQNFMESLYILYLPNHCSVFFLLNL